MANIVFQDYKRTFVNDYFIKGWWTDEENNPIRSAQVGQKVRFHIQTSPELPFDETFQFQIRDHDGQFFWYTMYDTISINKTGEDKLEFNQTTKLSEIVILEFTFDRNIHEKIDDDFGVEIELYVACRYNFKTTELANTSDTWLNLGYDDSDLFIKPAFPEVQYNLPEVILQKVT